MPQLHFLSPAKALDKELNPLYYNMNWGIIKEIQLHLYESNLDGYTA